MSVARPLADLAAQFERLPGIGIKSAQRLAYHVLRMPEDDVRRLAEALVHVRLVMRLCTVCQNVTDTEVCEVCQDPRRDRHVVCVVAEPRDVTAIERVHEYKGTYHVLHGLLSPIDGVGPEELKVRELLERLREDVTEVIVATNPSVDGDSTALYLAKLIKPLGVKVTRLAHGLPMGGELDYADSATLLSALEYRREL